MKRHLLGLVLSFLAGNSNAVVSPLIFSPSSPNNLDVITFTATTRDCEAFTAQIGTATVNGSTVRVLGSGLVRTNPSLCNFGNRTLNARIGQLPQGNYSVEVYIEDFTGFGTFLVRTDPLRVGVAVVQAPAFSSWSLLALLLGVGGIGWYAARRG